MLLKKWTNSEQAGKTPAYILSHCQKKCIPEPLETQKYEVTFPDIKKTVSHLDKRRTKPRNLLYNIKNITLYNSEYIACASLDVYKMSFQEQRWT